MPHLYPMYTLFVPFRIMIGSNKSIIPKN